MRFHKPVKKLTTLGATIAAAALLWLALSVGDEAPTAVAQTADTPTPQATAEPGDPGDQQLPPIKGKLNPPQYPNMDSNLNQIVQQAQSGQFTAQAAAANAPIHDGASVARNPLHHRRLRRHHRRLPRRQRRIPAQHRRGLHRGIHPRNAARRSVRAGRRHQHTHHHPAPARAGRGRQRRRLIARRARLARRRTQRAGRQNRHYRQWL